MINKIKQDLIKLLRNTSDFKKQDKIKYILDLLEEV